jgi:putative RecB family exonuclease
VEPLSVSKIQAYLGCPLKYRFQYIDRIPRPWRVAVMAFGTSIHAAVEWFHKERLDGRTPKTEEVIGVFNADWYAQNLEPLVFPAKESQESLKEKGSQMIRLYVEESDSKFPREIEQRFELDLSDPETGEAIDVRLRGYIDLVEEDGTLVELKTAARSIERGDLDRHLQLSTYALVLFLLHDSIPQLRLDQLLKTKTPRLERHQTTRSLEDLGWTARLIERTAQAIADGHFYPNPSWRCTECEYFAHCQKWRGS